MSRKNRKVFIHKKKIYRFFISVGIFAFVIGFFVFLFFIHDMPDLDNLESAGRRASIVFESYDRKNIAVYGDLFRNVVKIEKLPKYVGNAVIAIEDKRFYRHCGVDLFGIARAMWTNILNRRIVQGGSTLTQQLAKNLFLSRSKSIKRKVQEFILALWLEKKFSKKQILSIYVNRVYFGGGAYGIDAAAYRFFGKKAHKLTLYEAAKLASVLKSPATYSPFYNVEKSDHRTELVLSCMVEAGYITEEEMKDAMQDKERLSHPSIPMDENRYFTDWALEQVQELVGVGEEDLIVRTTLDAKLQMNATYVVRNVLNEYGFRNGARQMALVALDRTGAVRAMIGGHTYSTSQYNRALALRSFGSAFKYFVFLAALERGFNIHDHVSDLPISIGNWSPKNYHYKSIGSVSIQEAFVKSINTCAVRLAQKVGMPAIAKVAEQLGITSEIGRNFAAALGASGVNLLEITAAYGAIMLDGAKMVPFGIVSIKNQQGKMLYCAHQRHAQRVILPQNCEKMKTMMKATMELGTGRRAKLPVACYGKTGTSNDSRDASFIGFAPPLVTGIWTGNDDNSPMSQKVTGGILPAIAWRDFMMAALGIGKQLQEVKIQERPIAQISLKKEAKKTTPRCRRMKVLVDGIF
ncbi:MAG: PBP1A family penicillin-binding protein [Holosporaceae bacterium]|jgi:penicillin-binding protein 1A|nr:PBP1A family penicillin-binding protein [Holosporaceae bacterium]